MGSSRAGTDTPTGTSLGSRSAFSLAICGCFVLNAAAGETGTSAYVWQLPPGFPVPQVPADNPLSDAKVALGCRLFFDTQLSVTGTYSCASCHRPELAFTDGRARAVGATGDAVRRGAMTLTNVVYNAAYTWASDTMVSLEAQMQQPLFSTHPLEMGLSDRDDAWLAALARDYANEFQQSFPAEPMPVTAGNVIKAIAAFERTLISGRSAFDRYVFDGDHAALSPAAKRGMSVFFAKRAGCADCHFGVNFAGTQTPRGQRNPIALFANTAVYDAAGKPEEPLYDAGLIEISHQVQDRGKFRVPTLRNIAITAPYMHDGSLATLEDVIDHYTQGGRQASRGTNVAIQPIALTAAEKQELVAFLSSLTDAQFVERYSQPSPCR